MVFQLRTLAMTPLEYYQLQHSEGLIIEDQQQLNALYHLQQIYDDLLQESRKRAGVFSLFRTPQLIQGLYLWGGVGIGKSFLMDCLYHCLSFENKLRIHFHQFMQMIHRELKKHQGKKDPLQIIANELTQKTMLICFDEFFVSDITDAMLLGRLFKALFSQGVCLIATSNVAPDDLYKNGLQRKLFIPAIVMLKQNVTVMHIPSAIDYRLQHVNKAGIFYTPNDDIAHANMEKSFALLTKGAPLYYEPIKICNRFIPIIKRSGDSIWFDFNVICTVPRSQYDYLEIAETYNTIFISNIPIIPVNAKNMISLFIRMVDVLYDMRMRLVCSAAGPVEKIYSSHDSTMSDYKRTCSRLLEMQSEKYFISKLENGNRKLMQNY